MRGCLLSLFLFPAVILVAAWIILPRVAGPIIGGAMGLAGFSGSDQTITVTADPPVELLSLHADRIHVTASKATFQGITMSTVDLTLDDVSLFDRTAGTVNGTLTGVRLAPTDGPVVTVSSVGLSGTGSDIGATLTFSPADVKALAGAAIKGTLGTSISSVTLSAPDRATVVVGGVSVAGRLFVDSTGALVFRPTKATAGFSGQVALIAPGPAEPFRIATVAVTPAGITLRGTLEPSIFGASPSPSP